MSFVLRRLRWNRRTQSDARRGEERYTQRRRQRATMWTRLWKPERAVWVKGSLRRAAGTCNDVIFIRLIRVERSILRPGGGHYYLIANAIAYLITPAICIHRRVVGRESFARAISWDNEPRGREAPVVCISLENHFRGVFLTAPRNQIRKTRRFSSAST